MNSTVRAARILCLLIAAIGMWLCGVLNYGFAYEKEPESESNSLGMKLVMIRRGRFKRGMLDEAVLQANHIHTILIGPDLADERPAHLVQLTRSFRIAAHEVTVGQFRSFVEATDYKTDAERNGRGALVFNPQDKDSVDRFTAKSDCNWRHPGFQQGDDHPVVCVSWRDAAAFCDWLSKREKATYRLPTEAEWEYAALAGAHTIYVGGNDPDSVYAYGNIGDAALEAAFPGTVKRQRADHLKSGDGDGVVFTASVGTFKQNSWGLFDTHGNVWEWCSDLYYDRYYEDLTTAARKKGGSGPIVDPQGPETTTQHQYGDWRSMRGGSWYTGPMAARCASRAFGEAGDAFSYAGFRIVKEMQETTSTEEEKTPSLFRDEIEEAVWNWILEKSHRQQHIERTPDGDVKWVGFYDPHKRRGDFYAGSLSFDADGFVEKGVFNAMHFTNDDLVRIAGLKKLRALSADHNGWNSSRDKRPFSGAGLMHLRGLPLEWVSFSGSFFNDDGMRAAQELPQLRELLICHTRVTDIGVKALRNNDHIRRLAIGPQHSQRITEAALEDVVTIKSLEDLEFDETILTWEGGLKHLAGGKDRLKRLKLQQTLISDQDLALLRAALPATQIQQTPATAEQVRQMRRMNQVPKASR